MLCQQSVEAPGPPRFFSLINWHDFWLPQRFLANKAISHQSCNYAVLTKISANGHAITLSLVILVHCDIFFSNQTNLSTVTKMFKPRGSCSGYQHNYQSCNDSHLFSLRSWWIWGHLCAKNPSLCTCRVMISGIYCTCFVLIFGHMVAALMYSALGMLNGCFH